MSSIMMLRYIDDFCKIPNIILRHQDNIIQLDINLFDSKLSCIYKLKIYVFIDSIHNNYYGFLDPLNN